jgi:hypothetical protein
MVVRLAALIAAALLALIAAPAALAKDDVRATLVRSVDLDARQGERIWIEWKLEDERGRPFGAGGVFVRLRSAAGGRTVWAVTDGSGRFRVRATVPEGGIGRIEFGLQGWRTAGGRTTRADILFPLTNDPFARSRDQRPQAASKLAGSPLPAWLAVPITAAVVAGVALARRRARRV